MYCPFNLQVMSYTTLLKIKANNHSFYLISFHLLFSRLFYSICRFCTFYSLILYCFHVRQYPLFLILTIFKNIFFYLTFICIPRYVLKEVFLCFISTKENWYKNKICTNPLKFVLENEILSLSSKNIITLLYILFKTLKLYTEKGSIRCQLI
jgi:hypothetical protein